jgi:hypothetical protein
LRKQKERFLVFQEIVSLYKEKKVFGAIFTRGSHKNDWELECLVLDSA